MHAYRNHPRAPSHQLALALVLLCHACVDVGDFSGHWEGTIAADDAIRAGFAAETRLTAELTRVDLARIEGTMSTTDGRFDASPLQPIEMSSGDALSDLTFSGDPLRSYLLFSVPATDPEGEAVWIVLSLFPDEHVELRMMRRNDLFGVFTLSRRSR